eukprot:c3927_g1_i1.p1 GENE.c3927_g1_i1~~c3927_g1_i1.p1  ORF type:complete len:620 (-),score=165.29 c3927_g1_i1:86-1945(-)
MGVSCTVCLMASLVELYPPCPSTERGVPTVIKSHDKKDKLIYCNGKVCVYRSVSNPTVSDVYSGHSGIAITAASYAPNGGWIATGDARGKVKVWAPENVDKVIKLEIDAIGGEVKDIDWSPDGQRIVAVGNGRESFGKVFTWDSGNSVGEISGHAKKLNSVSYKSSRPFRIVTGSDDMQVNYYEGPPFKFVSAIKEHSNFVNCVRFSPDGNFFVTSASDRKVFLYDGKTGEAIGPLVDGGETAHEGGVYQLAWSPDSKFIVTASADKIAKVWDAQTRTVVRKLTINGDTDLLRMMVGATWINNTIVILTLDGDLHYFADDATVPTKSIFGHTTGVAALEYDNASKTLYSADRAGRVCAWKVGQGSVGRLNGPSKHLPQSSVPGVAVTGETLFVVSSDQKVRAASTGDLTASLAPVTLEHPALQVVAVPGVPGTVLVLTRTVVATFQAPLQKTFEASLPYAAVQMGISQDGLIVAIASDDGKLHFHNRSDAGLGAEIATLQVTTGKINAIVYSPSNELIAVADSERNIHIIDAQTHQDKGYQWRFHTASVMSVAWSPDSTKLVSASIDTNVLIWDINANAKFINKIAIAHTSGALGVTYLDDNTIASCGDDGCVRVWNLN